MIPARRFLVTCVAAAQLISWGTFYYALPVFVAPISSELALPRQYVFWGLSAALLTAVISAPIVGREIDRGRGRRVVILGHLLGIGCLVILSATQSPAAFFLVCCGLGISQAACLYDAGFSLIHRYVTKDAPRAILQVTLVAGFSGTLFVPGTQFAVDHWGWRITALCLALAAVIPLLLYLASLPSEAVRTPETRDSGGSIARVSWTLPLILLIGAFSASAAVFSTVTIHLLPLLIDRGMTGQSAAQVFAIIGPSQIAGRFLIAVRSSRFQPFRHGALIFAMLPVALSLLLVAGSSIGWLTAFALLFGMNSGLTTILRGTAPAQLCDKSTIGRVNGAIGAAGGLCRAAAPALFAWVLAVRGSETALLVTIGIAIGGGLAFVTARRLTLADLRRPLKRRAVDH